MFVCCFRLTGAKRKDVFQFYPSTRCFIYSNVSSRLLQTQTSWENSVQPRQVQAHSGHPGRCPLALGADSFLGLLKPEEHGVWAQ